jgi:hypothetical protein
LLAQIEALEVRIRRFDVPSVVYNLAEKPEQVWRRLTLEQKREVIRCLLEIRVHHSTTPSGSRRFDPSTVEVRWRGSVEVDPIDPLRAAAQ